MYTTAVVSRMLEHKKYVFKLKSHKNMYIFKVFASNPVILKFCTEHGSLTAMLCAKSQNHWTADIDVINKQDFMRFDSRNIFRWVYPIM